MDLFAFLVSPLGRIKVKMKKDSGLHPEVVVYRRGDWMNLGGGANRLIAARVTDLGETAAFYSQHVRLEPADDSWESVREPRTSVIPAKAGIKKSA